MDRKEENTHMIVLLPLVWSCVMEQNWLKYGFWLENRWVQLCPVNRNKFVAQSEAIYVLESVSQTVTDVEDIELSGT